MQVRSVMNNILFFCFVASFTTTLTRVNAQENVVWSPWTECEPALNCYKRRELECRVGGAELAGVRCISDGSIFEEISQSGCDDRCLSMHAWVHITTTQTCQGDCYDANRVTCYRGFTPSFVQGSIDYRLYRRVRCYNGASCSGTWTRTGSSSACSASCGGGTRVWNETCLDDEGQPSYNCIGTGGDPALSSTAQGNKITNQVLETCNNHPCETTTKESVYSGTFTSTTSGTSTVTAKSTITDTSTAINMSTTCPEIFVFALAIPTSVLLIIAGLLVILLKRERSFRSKSNLQHIKTLNEHEKNRLGCKKSPQREDINKFAMHDLGQFSIALNRRGQRVEYEDAQPANYANIHEYEYVQSI